MADEGLAKKDRICQFFASNAGLHFRSVDVAAALGLDARSVGQQLARLWRSGFVEKVQTGPFTTWRMKFQTYPGRNLHGPAAPKPACLTPHTPAKKSTRGSRTHEEGRNDSGHCAMGSPVVLGSTEGGNEEGEEEEDETDDQANSLPEVHSVRVLVPDSSPPKPPTAIRKSAPQTISSWQKTDDNLSTKKTGRKPPGNKKKLSTTCQVGQKGTKTGKTSSTSGSCKKKTPVKRKVGPESFRSSDQRTGKGKKTTSQTTSREDCSSRSGTDSESTPLKIVSTGLKRKLGVESTTTDQGLIKKVKKTKTQTTGREDCRGRSATDSGLSTQVQKMTHLMPASVSYQKTAASTVKKKTDEGQKRRMKKTTSPNTDAYSSSTSSTSGKETLQYNPSPMPATLAPSLNRPSGNMEIKLMNFIREAQGMLVMTGDDVAKALGSKPKETHRLLLHMQRTGRVRKVCDKPTRWMMLGQGKGGPARKRQTEAVTTTTTQQKELPSVTTAQQREPPPLTKHQLSSMQTYSSHSFDGSPTRRRQREGTTTTQQKELPPLTKNQVSSTQTYRSHSFDGLPARKRKIEATTATQQKELPPLTKHQVLSTQIYRSHSIDESTEEGTSKTSYSATGLSECSQNGQRLAHHMSTCEEEEEDSEEVVSTSTQVPAQFGTCIATVEDEEEDSSCVFQEQDSGFLEDSTFYTERKNPSPTVQQASSLPSKKQSRKSNQKSQGEDISCVFQEQDSGFLEDITFYAERNKSSPTVQHALSLSNKKQSKTSNQTSQVTTTTRRCLSPCGKYVKKTPVNQQVLTDKQSVRMSTENGSSYTKPTAAKSTSLGNLQSQNSNHTGVSSTSCHAKKLGLSNFRIPKKNPLPGKHLEKSHLTVGQKSGDSCGSKRMSVAPSEFDASLLDSSKDSTDKNKQDANTQKDISTIKTPPHILKHSVSYFASTTKEPDIKPKLHRASKTTKDIPKLQNQTETSFERTKDNGVSMKEPLADLDVMVDVMVDKSPQIQNQLHSCGTCGSNKDLQHTPLSVLRRNSIKTSPSGPPKLYPHMATESTRRQCMVGTLGSCDSPPVLVHQEEELRSIGTESPSSLRAAKRNLYPCFSLEESLEHQQRSTSCTSIHEQSGYKEDEHTGFRRGLVETVVSVTPGSGYFPLTDTDTKRKQQQLTACSHDWLLNKVNDRKIAGRCGGQKNVSGPESFSSEIGGTKESFSSSQDTGTDPRRAHGRGVYAELQDSSRVTRGEVIGQAGHGSQQSTFTSLHEQQHGRGLSCSQEQIRNNRQANFTSLEPKTAVAKNTDTGVGSFIDTKQHRMTSIDGRAHHMGPVLGAERSVPHPLGYHRTDHTCSVHQMNSSGQGGDRRHLGRPQGSEKVHQALVTRQTACFEVPASHEVPRMSVGGDEEKLVRGTIDLTQEERSTKASWPQPTDYWCDGVQDVFHAKDRKLSSDTEELLTTGSHTASEAKARRCISSTEETVAHTVTAHTASDNILPAKVRNLLFGTEKAVPDITSMHTASEDVFPAIARRLSFGTEETVPQTTTRRTTSEGVLAKARRLSFDAEVTVPLRSTYTASKAKTMLSPGAEETVPHTTTIHTARCNVGHSSKSDNVSILEEQALHAKVSNLPAQNEILCKVSDASIRNSERVSTSCDGDVEPFHVMKSMQPSRDCSTYANCMVASTQASRSPSVHTQPSCTGSAPVLGADHHVHCKGVKQTPVNPEGLCISEKSQQNESTKWQRPRSPKSFWIDYWSKAESKDTKSDDLKDRSAENSRLVACSTTNADNVVSPKELSSDLMKNYSQSKVCAMEVLSKDNTNFPDEKSMIVFKEERKIFHTAETQTSEGFAHTSHVQRDKIANMKPDSQTKDLSDDVDIKVSLEEKVCSDVTSLTGPEEQSTWTQPKALYATVDRRPQEEKSSEVQEPRGQEVMDEVKIDDGSQVEPRGQEQAAVVEVRGHDGSEVDQVSRHQVSVAMVTPQGSRSVVVAAHPSGTTLHPAQPVPEVHQSHHPIVQLNELCQRNHLPMCFQDISVTGPSHRPRVQVAAVVGDCTFQAEASSKKAARRQAAREALQALYQEGYK